MNSKIKGLPGNDPYCLPPVHTNYVVKTGGGRTRLNNGFYDVIAIPVINGLVEMAKLAGLQTRFCPILAVLLGIIMGVYIVPLIAAADGGAEGCHYRSVSGRTV